jgi:hypothetical protein
MFVSWAITVSYSASVRTSFFAPRRRAATLDFASTYSYLAAMRIGPLAEKGCATARSATPNALNTASVASA